MKQKLARSLMQAIMLVSVIVFFSCQKNINDRPSSPGGGGGNGGGSMPPKELKNFVQVNLASNSGDTRDGRNDVNLVNARGIIFPGSSVAFVSACGTGLGASYTLDGVPMEAILVPCAGTSGSVSQPTANAHNSSSSDFMLPNGSPAQLIFVTAEGGIAGWNAGSTAVKKVDRFPNASYFGVAIAANGGNNFLYVANFAENKIEVYNKNWAPVSTTFTDPNLPGDYSPFNIQNLDGKLYVSYAKKNTQGKKERGGGYINVFNPDGTFVKRFAAGGKLDIPWAIVEAPANFWGQGSSLANYILVGNAGDGHINVFDENGNYMGPLYTNGKAIEIDGLWGMAFPPPTSLNSSYLYFAAGPSEGRQGLFGYIKTLYLN